MKNILLPTDFSENSWNAINYAIRFFKKMPCNFYLLHVDRLSYLLTGDIPYAPTDTLIEEVYTKPSKIKLRRILKDISKQFPQHKNHRFYTLTDYNLFIDSVKKAVKEHDIDFIVMGTKGAAGLDQYIMGTNTSDVITRVDCNVIAIPENARYTKLAEIVFPTDLCLNYDIQTLHPLLDILETKKPSLKILHVGQKESDLNKAQIKNKELLDKYFKNNDITFHFLTNKNIENGIQCFIESRPIDMICMVAKSLNYFQRILFHSKVEELSYHLDIPFLVLHEKN